MKLRHYTFQPRGIARTEIPRIALGPRGRAQAESNFLSVPDSHLTYEVDPDFLEHALLEQLEQPELPRVP